MGSLSACLSAPRQSSSWRGAPQEKHQIKLRFALSDEGHVWRNWRNYLADFVPQRFR